MYNFVLMWDYIIEFLDSVLASNQPQEVDTITMLTCFLTKAVEQIKPVKVYKNFKEDRKQLIKDQQNKVGVYCLVNLINGHSYVGSSTNLAVRMRNYLNNVFPNTVFA